MTLPAVQTPYGLRQVALVPYTDGQGTALSTTATVLLPYAQIMAFSEAETFTELRGDDRLIATHGHGAQVNGSVDAGGISFAAWTVLGGGTTVSGGTTPNLTSTYRKFSSSTPRPYFRAEGQIISDSGGDMHAKIYRCKCNSNIDGQFGDGAFFITKAPFVGLPLVNSTTFDLLYELIQNQGVVAIPTTPVVNPLV